MRIVLFNNFPPMFDLACRWAADCGHEIALVVSTPGPKARRTEGYKQIAALTGERNIELLITTRLKSVATPVLAALKPDLILSASFPWLFPPELLATARIGAVNLHPALLPAYRGPNAIRQIYDGAKDIGFTLHWTANEFDTGNILSQHGVSLPKPGTPENIFNAWAPAAAKALYEGAARAIAGDPGTRQTEAGASYAGVWTAEEEWIDLTEMAERVQYKVTALNMLNEPIAKARIDGKTWRIERVDLHDASAPDAAPGTIVQTTADGALVRVGDCVVKIKAQLLE